MAQIAAATHHPPVAGSGSRRIHAGLPARVVAVGGRVEPIRAPLPHIARHLIKAVAVGSITLRRGRAEMPVGLGVRGRKHPLPDVHAVTSLRLQFVAPRKPFLREPTPRGVFPLGLSRQAFSHPRCVSDRIDPRHLHDRVCPALLDVRTRPLGMPPRRTINPAPPLAPQHAQPHRRRLLLERKMPEKNKAPTEALALGLVPRRVHKRVELLVRHTRRVEIECRQLHRMGRTFAVERKSVVAIRPHLELARRNQGHTRRRPRRRRYRKFWPHRRGGSRGFWAPGRAPRNHGIGLQAPPRRQI